MKFTRPEYDSVEKQYCSGVKDGVRFESELEDSSFSPSIEFLQSTILSQTTANTILDLTKSWFTKPLTLDWLLPRLTCDLPLPTQSGDFKCTWTLTKLFILKEKFILSFELLTIPIEKIQISFPEPPPPSPSPSQSDETTRRTQQKALVQAARLRAAKALFKAERLTQAFVQSYGETDWEDEMEEDSDP